MFLKLQIEAHSNNYWSQSQISSLSSIHRLPHFSSAGDSHQPLPPGNPLVPPFSCIVILLRLIRKIPASSAFSFLALLLFLTLCSLHFPRNRNYSLSFAVNCQPLRFDYRSTSSPFISLSFLSSNSLFLVVCWNFFI